MPDDAVRAVAELAASQHRAFTRRQAAVLNFDRSRVATAIRLGWLDEPYPGVLVMAGSGDLGPGASWRRPSPAVGMPWRRIARGPSSSTSTGSRTATSSSSASPRPPLARGTTRVIAHHVVAARAVRRGRHRRHPMHGLGPHARRSRRRRHTAARAARTHRCSAPWYEPAVDPAHREPTPPPGPAGTGVLMRSSRRSRSKVASRTAGSRSSWPSASMTRRFRRSCSSTPSELTTVGWSPRPTSASRRCGSGWRPTAGDSTSARTPNRSTSSATWRAGACGWQLHYLGWFATRRPREVLTIVKQIIAARQARTLTATRSHPRGASEFGQERVSGEDRDVGHRRG